MKKLNHFLNILTVHLSAYLSDVCFMFVGMLKIIPLCMLFGLRPGTQAFSSMGLLL